MAEILPIRAWRYNKELSVDIDALTSPLFDVVSEKQRKALYQNPNNSIHLSVPQPPDANNRAARILNEWKEKAIIQQDKLAGIYVHYQYFKLLGSPKEFCRKGFIIHIRTYDWEEKVILRHENTIPKAVNDRIELLEKTQLHASPTHGLYMDASHTLEPYMDEAVTNPIYETDDYQGVRDVLAVIHDARVMQHFINLIQKQSIILADGHHRYESSLINKKRQQARNPNNTGKEGYHYHLMYLTNSASDDLCILPTHRLINGIENFDEVEILKKLETNFIIKTIDETETLNEVITGKRWVFGLLFKENAYKIKLKPESIYNLAWPFPVVIKELDLTVMHYFIIELALGILGKDQRTSDKITFDRSFTDCHKKVLQDTAQLAIITNEVSIEDVKRVCKSGYTMPQKSTYFYPKVIGGFLFSSIKEEEFTTPIYSPF